MNRNKFDAIVIGTGMGGMTTGSLLARDGFKVLLLEAAHVPGGCSSSFYRKGYTFESGATTLIGFDAHQPLGYLEKQLGITIPRRELSPSMSVWLEESERPLIRYKSTSKWIQEATKYFGNESGQQEFWQLAKAISDVVWKVSLRNAFFPPQKWSDWLSLLTNNDISDTWILPYAFSTTAEIATKCGVDTPGFMQFLDEQLMITAQASAGETPFVVGAAGLTYTNYSNYYVEGGLLEMVRTIQDYIEANHGELHVKEPVINIRKGEQAYSVITPKGSYRAPILISNVPIWNLPELTEGDMRDYFEMVCSDYDKSVGALTFGIAMEDIFDPLMTLHHQIHIPEHKQLPGMDSNSIFVSLSRRGDTKRAPVGTRTLNISTHADSEYWFRQNGQYDHQKKLLSQQLLLVLDQFWDPFDKNKINTYYSATPLTWENWVYRFRGRVGGIPQWKHRFITDWPSNTPPFKGLYLCGDTVYPGQGIPGVTLSGINAYKRVKQNNS
jgi:C-3',4' desaturase CrtD